MEFIIDFVRRLFELSETADKREDTLSGILGVQRRAIPQQYTDLHEVTGGSHQGVEMVKRGESTQELEARLFSVVDDMARSEVPYNVSTQPRFDAEQELVELVIFERLYRLAMGKITLEEIKWEGLTYQGMQLSAQAYLFGWADAATEWAKAMRDYLNDSELVIAERAKLIQNVVKVLLFIREQLGPYATEPTTDAYTRRFFADKLRGKLNRIAELVDKLKDRRGSLVDKVKFMRELRANQGN